MLRIRLLPARRTIATTLAIVGALGGALTAAPLHAQSPAPTDSAASLVARQVDVGAQWFRASCLECHATSALANADFRIKWGGRPAFELFELIRSTMPEHEPGSLTPGTYASIVAYLLKLNGMPAGTAVVPADSAGLSALRMTFPPASHATTTPR